MLFQYADMLMYTLPAPRYNYYQSSDGAVVQSQILHHMDKVTEFLGFYPIDTSFELLE